MWCAAYIRATREFDLAVAAQPLAEFDKLLAADPTVVILDLRDPSFIDARGMRVLIDLRTSCEEQGRRFVLVRGQRRVHRMLVLCNLVQAFEFVDSAAEAGELTGVADGLFAATDTEFRSRGALAFADHPRLARRTHRRRSEPGNAGASDSDRRPADRALAGTTETEPPLEQLLARQTSRRSSGLR